MSDTDSTNEMVEAVTKKGKRAGAAAEKGGKKKRKVPAIKDPNPPKRATTAYMFFMRERTPTFKAEHPDLKFGDVTKGISAEWKAMAPNNAKRAKYEKMAADDKERYERELQQRPQIPKKPQTAFILFSNANRDKVMKENPGIAFGEVGKKLGEMWRNLSDAEKAPFAETSKNEKEGYAAAMDKFRSDHPDFFTA